MSNQKKIRDLERLLKRKQAVNDNCDIIIQKIADLKEAKEEVKNEEKKRKNAVKYHMVKFIERKKLTRLIRSLETKLKSGEEEGGGDKKRSKIEKKIKKLKEDLAYVMYFPTEFKYVALYAGNGDASASSSSSSSGPTNTGSEQARTIALAAWRNDVKQEGITDKVTHAMKVEYTGGSSSGKKSASSSSSLRGESIGVDDEDNEIYGDSNTQEKEGGHRPDDGQLVPPPSRNSKKSIISSTFLNSSSSGSSSSSKEVVHPAYDGKKIDNKKRKSNQDNEDNAEGQGHKSKRSVPAEDVVGDNNGVEGDAFFVEEAGGGAAAVLDTDGPTDELKNIKSMLSAHGGKWSERHKKKRVFKNDRRINRK